MAKDLSDLDPVFRTKLEAALADAKAVGLLMVPFETIRSPISQGELWRRSRNGVEIKLEAARLRSAGAHYLADCIIKAPASAGKWATNAVPGLSWHQWGQACDLYVDADGVPGGAAEWGKMDGYAKFAGICRDHGLNHGYFWKSKDSPHVQLPIEPKPTLDLVEIDRIMKARFT